MLDVVAVEANYSQRGLGSLAGSHLGMTSSSGGCCHRVAGIPVYVAKRGVWTRRRKEPQSGRKGLAAEAKRDLNHALHPVMHPLEQA